MATPCFYVMSLSLETQQITLSKEESKHAKTVRRIRQNQLVRLINGRGLSAVGVIDVTQNLAIIRDVKVKQARALHQIHILTALPKGDRQKQMIDALTQLGVSYIGLVEFTHSVSKVKPTTTEKLQKIAISACKQSQNPYLPTIEMVEDWEQWLLVRQEKMALCFADLTGKMISSIPISDQPVVIVVGPEGGLDEKEKDTLQNMGCQKIALSGYILRTEIAAITAVSQFITRS